MTCIFQFGASYQTSPTRMSSLPSLLTSATATPSERNALSTTVFFQVILYFALPAPSFAASCARTAGSSGAGSRSAANSQRRHLMGCLASSVLAAPAGRDGTPNAPGIINPPAADRNG